jgi:hypothetical protein
MYYFAWSEKDSAPLSVFYRVNNFWYVTRSRVPSTLSQIRGNGTSVYPPLVFLSPHILAIYVGEISDYHSGTDKYSSLME